MASAQLLGHFSVSLPHPRVVMEAVLLVGVLGRLLLLVPVRGEPLLWEHPVRLHRVILLYHVQLPEKTGWAAFREGR